MDATLEIINAMMAITRMVMDVTNTVILKLVGLALEVAKQVQISAKKFVAMEETSEVFNVTTATSLMVMVAVSTV
jgi:hypothetical protein